MEMLKKQAENILSIVDVEASPNRFRIGFWIDTCVSKCLDRAQVRNRKADRNSSQKYLEKLERAYKVWFQTKNLEPLLVDCLIRIDGNRELSETVHQIFEYIVSDLI